MKQAKNSKQYRRLARRGIYELWKRKGAAGPVGPASEDDKGE